MPDNVSRRVCSLVIFTKHNEELVTKIRSLWQSGEVYPKFGMETCRARSAWKPLAAESYNTAFILTELLFAFLTELLCTFLTNWLLFIFLTELFILTNWLLFIFLTELLFIFLTN
jgi:hypothetical protein